ncbi:MAG: type II toxin-antitoxin system RelE/ParE family toxin [Brachymonas sp.]|nr:type II toxin-antitoxin system RelE/ParE family toxin [Brachymonas sp.]
MHKVRIAPSAEGDLLDAYQFYERQESGVGDYFLLCLASDIESLGIYAGIHTKSRFDLYHTPSKRFPFSIYYHFDGETATVAAVLDARRNPQSIRREIAKR